MCTSNENANVNVDSDAVTPSAENNINSVSNLTAAVTNSANSRTLRCSGPRVLLIEVVIPVETVSEAS